MPNVPALAITNLRKQYRGGTLANDNLTFQVHRGEVYGLLGPNGAGKTTLVRQVLGLLKPTSGSISIEGVDVVATPGYARSNVAFLPQGQFNMEGVKVAESIEGIARLRGMQPREARARTEELIARLEVEQFRSTMLIHASGGVRRLAGFAATIVSGARLLVLDEPTNDIDPARRQLLWTMLSEVRDAGTAVLLVTHNLSEAERVVDRLAIMDHGRILQEGDPATLRSLVMDGFRVEVVPREGFSPHVAMGLEPSPNIFRVAAGDVGLVCGWLQSEREAGRVADFRVGPPSLDDIYAATLQQNLNALQESA